METQACGVWMSKFLSPFLYTMKIETRFEAVPSLHWERIITLLWAFELPISINDLPPSDSKQVVPHASTTLVGDLWDVYVCGVQVRVEGMYGTVSSIQRSICHSRSKSQHMYPMTSLESLPWSFLV